MSECLRPATLRVGTGALTTRALWKIFRSLQYHATVSTNLNLTAILDLINELARVGFDDVLHFESFSGFERGAFGLWTLPLLRTKGTGPSRRVSKMSSTGSVGFGRQRSDAKRRFSFLWSVFIRWERSVGWPTKVSPQDRWFVQYCYHQYL